MRKNNLYFIKRLVFFSFIIFISCQQKVDELEIYLLKQRVVSTEGIPISEARKIKEFKSIYGEFNDDTNFDIINKRFIFGGKFDVKLSQLEKEPFIKDSEIKSIDTIKGEISFTKSASDKIKKLRPNMINGKQFAICLNKKVVFTGYFWSKYSSYLGTWNCIEYNHLDDKTNLFSIYKSNGMNKIRTKINFKEYYDLVKYLNDTNRLTK